jgi:hypothetical protein
MCMRIPASETEIEADNGILVINSNDLPKRLEWVYLSHRCGRRDGHTCLKFGLRKVRDKVSSITYRNYILGMLGAYGWCPETRRRLEMSGVPTSGAERALGLLRVLRVGMQAMSV